MNAEIPSEVLSEHFQDRMEGRRLLHAVFTTFELEPGFFEQEILPAFLDVDLSHVPAIRLVQLEDFLRSMPGHVAVYYDANGLVRSTEGSARLDVRRTPVRVASGIFHPKNVFALVEDTESGDDGRHARTLLVAALSANLTRAGWWENLEVCHVEEIGEGAVTSMKDDLLAFLADVRGRAPAESDHQALDQIRDFLRATEQHPHRTISGSVQPHFHGAGAFADFLASAAGAHLKELYLEIVSPFFDDKEECRPLAEILRRFRPRETRVFLPRGDGGEALCDPSFYEWVRQQEGVSWGRFPKNTLRRGRSENAPSRRVHAKIYRFFSVTPKRELIAVGSVNLTTPAHQSGGNVESALLVDIRPPRRPSFWLEPDESRPREFGRDLAGEDAVTSIGSRLALRYTWEPEAAEAYWDGAQPSPDLEIESAGTHLFALPSVAPRSWTRLPDQASARLGASLRSSSFVTVLGDRPDPVAILVEEQAMWRKPTLLAELSVKDILRYWSLLTPEQRNEFLAARAAELVGTVGAEALLTRARPVADTQTLFDHLAGIFHAFECLQKATLTSLDAGNEKDALYRLFGAKHDSLGNLLARLEEDRERDAIDRYLIGLSARQLCARIQRTHPAFWAAHPAQARDLQAAIARAIGARADIAARGASDMPAFLDWFEDWFVRPVMRPEPRP
jgi:hypothetical protein